MQLPLTPAFTVSLGEGLRELQQHLFAVFGALTLQDFGLDAFADLPIEQGDFGIDGNSSALFGGINQLPDFLKQEIAWLSQVIAYAAMTSLAAFVAWLAVSAVSSPVKAFCRMACLSSLRAASFWR